MLGCPGPVEDPRPTGVLREAKRWGLRRVVSRLYVLGACEEATWELWRHRNANRYRIRRRESFPPGEP